jgi:hypothetical protein
MPEGRRIVEFREKLPSIALASKGKIANDG